MPLTRYQIRNEYSLADPELFKAADKDDPEALLEGVAMAGLVGVLRQLGDLAESVSLSLSFSFGLSLSFVVCLFCEMLVFQGLDLISQVCVWIYLFFEY